MPDLPYLHARWHAGEQRPRVLWREIRQQGFPASEVHGRRLVDGWPRWPRSHMPSPPRGIAAGPPAAKPEVVSYALHKTRWLRMKTVSDLSATESADRAALTRLCPQSADAPYRVRSFHTFLTERTLDHFPPGVEQCEHAGIAELVGFAQGLRRDYPAVAAAGRSPWSQGQTAGQLNRRKMLKRPMYGRAGFDLLRRRVVQQPTCAP